MYGIKASRTGYDIATASDKQLAFTSDAPLLPIEAEGEITINAPSGGGIVSQDIYTHNLGYTPVFIIDRLSGYEYFFPLWGKCNKSKIWFEGYLADGENTTLRWRIFRRPIETNFTTKIVNSSDATKGLDDDYGVIVSLPGKDISSKDKRDFSIRSDCRQLMVAKSGYIGEDVGSLTVSHNLGYKPMYLVYIGVYGEDGVYRMASQADDLSLTVTDTSVEITVYTPPWPKVGYILFRDTLKDRG